MDLTMDGCVAIPPYRVIISAGRYLLAGRKALRYTEELSSKGSGIFYLCVMQSDTENLCSKLCSATSILESIVTIASLTASICPRC